MRERVKQIRTTYAKEREVTNCLRERQEREEKRGARKGKTNQKHTCKKERGNKLHEREEGKREKKEGRESIRQMQMHMCKKEKGNELLQKVSIMSKPRVLPKIHVFFNRSCNTLKTYTHTHTHNKRTNLL